MNRSIKLYIISFIVFSHGLNSQSHNMAYFQSEIKKTDGQRTEASSDQGTLLKSYQTEKELRIGFKKLLEDSLAELKIENIDSFQPGNDSALSEIQNKIALDLYRTDLANTHAHKTLEEYIFKKIYLKQINNHLINNNSTDNLQKTKLDDFQEMKNLLVIQENMLQKINKKIDEIKATLENKKTAEPTQIPEEETSNTFSLIKQIIASSIESKITYVPNYEMDNKLFEDRKGFMEWPIDNADFKKTMANGAVDLIGSNELVKCISQGKVIYAKKLPEGTYTIVILHDNDYYSVYANLASSLVGYGEQVNYQQILGSLKPKEDQRFLLEFQIWKKTNILNPSRWLKNG